MKKILIIGENSYIGNNLKIYLESFLDNYKIDIVSSRNDEWKCFDFSFYDVVINVAAIVHKRKVKADLYYDINRDLAIELAEKAKKEKIKQFIQLSTMSVFGVDYGVIDENTPLNPISDYGKSKLEADMYLQNIKDKKFKVCIIRPPMVYGRDCKGNYIKLEKYVEYISIFPNLINKKDFIFIENLLNFIKYLIDNENDGVFYPRDLKPISTAEIVRLIAINKGKKIFFINLFNPILKILLKRIKVITLVFADNYCVIDSKLDWSPKITTTKAIEKIYKNIPY